MDGTVTIGKSHFEALLRRAEFHTSGNTFATPDQIQNVTISKAEHDYLTRAAREYNILRNALFHGGLTPEKLDILISGEDSQYLNKGDAQNAWKGEAAAHGTNPVPVTISSPLNDRMILNTSEGIPNNGGYLTKPQTSYSRVNSFGFAGSSPDSPTQDDQFNPDLAETQPQRAPYPRHDQRTILFSNLADRTTHKDLVSIIRGGRLLDIYIRNDRSATVSFVEGAQEFLNYAKRNDFYIHSKRVEVRWNERQFHLPGHVANKIATGATRNIVVRGGAAKLTEEGIREDLDHIHNLVVIDVFFKNGDAYISTNSLHNALFARTCMMSRTLYKGLRIEWYPDECAAPLPKPRQPSWRAPEQPKKPVVPTVTNPYALLDIDCTDDGTESEDEEDKYHTGHGVGLGNWADAAIAA